MKIVSDTNGLIHVTKEPQGRVRDILIHAFEHITREWRSDESPLSHLDSYKILTQAWREINADLEFCDEMTLFPDLIQK
jgi:AAA+ ATPase superfamily predicted ATPase